MICPRCGEWTERPRVEEIGDPARALAHCAVCGAAIPFDRFPLWFVTGSSGAGKTTLGPLLRPLLPGWVVFEGEAIGFWRFGDEHGYGALYEQWLKVAREVAANGPPVLMLAMALPEQLATCPSRRHFHTLRMLGLVCDRETQAARLRARPAWRRSSDPAFIADQCAYSRRLAELASLPDPPLALLDTTTGTPEGTARAVARWAGRAPGL